MSSRIAKALMGRQKKGTEAEKTLAQAIKGDSEKKQDLLRPADEGLFPIADKDSVFPVKLKSLVEGGEVLDITYRVRDDIHVHRVMRWDESKKMTRCDWCIVGHPANGTGWIPASAEINRRKKDGKFVYTVMGGGGILFTEDCTADLVNGDERRPLKEWEIDG